MRFQQQIGARARVKLFWDLSRNGALRIAISRAIVLTFGSLENPFRHMHTIRGNSRQRNDSGEQKNSVSTRIGNAVKALQNFPCFREGSHQRRPQIASELIFDPHRKFLETLGPQLRNHSSVLDCSRKLGWLCSQQVLRLDPNLLFEFCPPLTAGRVTGRISAIPPHEKFVRIDGKRRLLRTVELF